MNRLSFFKSCAAVCLALAALTPAHAQKKKNVLDIKESITDENIIYPEADFEAESRKMLEGWYMQNYMATDDRYATKDDVNTSDATYRQRLAELPTIIDMPFNQVVKSHIERYTKRGRPMVASLLGLSNYYMPIFEQALEEAGLPLELKYLPVIESGLDPNAVSKAGAAGLWQFMPIAAKGLHMEYNSIVDERRDPYVSSQKAAKFLKDLYTTYGDWSLAIAAYNCGPGNVNKALRRAGGDNTSNLDFWAIYDYLPAETRGYVPAFIAANYVMNYYQNHNISPVIPKRPLITDTLHINKRVHFNQISKVLDIPIEELRMLNPQFRNDVIPGSASKSYNLILPSQQVHAYIMSENEILGYDAEKYARRTDATPGKSSGNATVDEEYNPADYVAALDPDETDVYEEMQQAPTRNRQPEPEAEPETPAPSRRNSVAAENNSQRTLGPADPKTKTHKVEPGESLASIAAKYGVGPEDIKTWNNLKRNSVRTGQVLRIAGNTSAKADEQAAQAQQPKPERTANKKQETAAPVKKNETVAATKATPAKKAETQPVKKQNETAAAKKQNETASSYKKKAGQPEPAQTSKKAKANTKEAVATAKKGAQQPENDKKKGKKAVEPAQPKEHTVASGESYDRIAKKYGVTTEELKKANNATSDKIQPNQKLKIPAKKGDAKEAANSKGNAKDNKNAKANNNAANDKNSKKGNAQAAAKSNEHTVASGESYDRIAKKHGISTEELKKANNAKSDMLQPGQKLKIPAKKANNGKKK